MPRTARELFLDTFFKKFSIQRTSRFGAIFGIFQQKVRVTLNFPDLNSKVSIWNFNGIFHDRLSNHFQTFSFGAILCSINPLVHIHEFGTKIQSCKWLATCRMEVLCVFFCLLFGECLCSIHEFNWIELNCCKKNAFCMLKSLMSVYLCRCVLVPCTLCSFMNCSLPPLA